MFNTFKQFFIDLPLMFNLHNFYLKIYSLFVCLFGLLAAL